MPLPISHSLAGATVFAAADEDGTLRAWPRLVLAVVVANAPDLDLIPGLLVGHPNRFHHGASHSLAMALLVGVAAWAAVRCGLPAWPTGRRRSAFVTGLVVTALWASHVLLDALGEDSRPPVGVPLLWPVQEGHVQLAAWFPQVQRLGGAAGPLEFAASLLQWHNLVGVAVETATLAPLLVLVVWLRKARRRRRG